MENPTSQCAPLCGGLGHQYVMLMAWRCHHHGAVTLDVRRWRDVADGTELLEDVELRLGPFDTSADSHELVEHLREALRQLIDEPSPL